MCCDFKLITSHYITTHPELHTRNFVLMGLVFIVVPFLPPCGLFLDVGFTVAERILFMPRCEY